MLQTAIGEQALKDRRLAIDCARHARVFFYSADLGLEHAVPGTLVLAPSTTMLEPLRRDYEAMKGMILGVAPAFDDVVEAIGALETRLNECT